MRAANDAGFSDYGIRINPTKTRANFEALPGRPKFRCTYQTPDGKEFIKWCGLLINCSSLEVQADYTRYSHQKLQCSLSLTLHKARAPLSQAVGQVILGQDLEPWHCYTWAVWPKSSAHSPKLLICCLPTQICRMILSDWQSYVYACLKFGLCMTGFYGLKRSFQPAPLQRKSLAYIKGHCCGSE